MGIADSMLDAVGVNTPAHLVIIKGTTVWRGAKNGYEELSVSTILQMIGRAVSLQPSAWASSNPSDHV
jgi:antiviral helicase SLH1